MSELSPETSVSAQENDSVTHHLESIELLSEPIVRVSEDGASLEILALGEQREGEARTALGYISTKSGNATMLDEFSGVPTGRYRRGVAVKGWVAGNNVYSKNVYTDGAPLPGLRTAIAQRRARSAVKSRLV